MTKPKGKFNLESVSPLILLLLVVVVMIILIKDEKGTVTSRLWFELTFLIWFWKTKPIMYWNFSVTTEKS